MEMIYNSLQLYTSSFTQSTPGSLGAPYHRVDGVDGPAQNERPEDSAVRVRRVPPWNIFQLCRATERTTVFCGFSAEVVLALDHRHDRMNRSFLNDI